jgi:hypothetical protein
MLRLKMETSLRMKTLLPMISLIMVCPNLKVLFYFISNKVPVMRTSSRSRQFPVLLFNQA